MTAPDSAIRPALESLLASPQFAASARACRFLRFIVETALGGRGDTLKEYTLGVEVFDRAPSFDPASDTIVRVEAVKLRKRLAAYYRGPGRSASWIIDVPKGAYVPRFRPRAVRAARSAPTSIAVLRFLNLDPTADSEFWSDGLTDELASVLARASRLRVVSRTSAFAFRGKPEDVRSIGRQSGAAFVVEGSVRRQGRRVRVSAQLIEVATGVQIWSETLERELQDAWTVQQEIARSIVAAIHVELTLGDRRRMSRRHAAVSAAFELYLKGRTLLDTFSLSSQHEALQIFEQASAADPDYPLPLLGAARARMNLALLDTLPPREIVPVAKADLQKALALDPDFAEAHGLLASLLCRHEWNWAEAEKHYRVALRLSPHAAGVHDEYAANYLAPVGRIEEALAENRAARELDPFSLQPDRSHALAQKRIVEQAGGGFVTGYQQQLRERHASPRRYSAPGSNRGDFGSLP